MSTVEQDTPDVAKAFPKDVPVVTADPSLLDVSILPERSTTASNLTEQKVVDTLYLM